MAFPVPKSIYTLLSCSLIAAPAAMAAKLPDISQKQIERQIEQKNFSFHEMRALGEQIFAFPFTKEHGYGDHRGTLQATPWEPNGFFRRIGGLDAQSCFECHGLHSAAVIPATQMIGGSGTLPQMVMFMPLHIDMSGEGGDGEIDFDGRVINPPHLFGAGGVELVAKEMTRHLQLLAKIAQRRPNTWVPLKTHGVSFGKIRYLRGDHCDMIDHSDIVYVEDMEKTRPKYWSRINPYLQAPQDEYTKYEKLCADTKHIHGVDDDLVIKPFGRKGSNFTTRDFDRGAMDFHFGIQPVEVVGNNEDPDGDGVRNEITAGQMSLLAMFTTSLPKPITKPTRHSRKGFKLFKQVGCSSCHIPEIKTNGRKLPFSFPEVAMKPYANVFFSLDLTKPPMNFAKAGKGIRVPMFSDLKRHDMGYRLMENLAEADDKANREFITARLWGIADSAPYLHDGRAATLHEAIEWHGGKAQKARNNYMALRKNQQKLLLDFLHSLKSPRLPK